VKAEEMNAADEGEEAVQAIRRFGCKPLAKGG
jgi:hypothetical protein